jgi:hypothetical protein
MAGDINNAKQLNGTNMSGNNPLMNGLLPIDER